MPSPKQPLLTTGVSGLVGTHFAQSYNSLFEIDNLDILHPHRPTDITNLAAVLAAFEHSTAQTVVHLAAFTDVSKAWEQRDDKSGSAYKVNVEGTKNIIEGCRQFGKQLIYISTAYVFDGKKETPYAENDSIAPIEWYGQTKAEAEVLVQSAEIPWTILRIDQPFTSVTNTRPDIVKRIVSALKTNDLPPQFTNHTFGPTFIDDFSKILHWVITTGTTGLYHASSGEQWSDYNFALLVQKTLQISGDIFPGDLQKYLETTNRPYQKNTALNTTKLFSKLPFSVQSITDAMAQVVI
jgi:dTDP-4-dehydrorhamnose reductase